MTRSREFSYCTKCGNRNIFDPEDNLWSQKSKDLLSTSSEQHVKRNHSLRESKKALFFTGPFDFITCHRIKWSFQNLWELKYYGPTTADKKNDPIFYFLQGKQDSRRKKIIFVKFFLSKLILRTELLQVKSICLCWFVWLVTLPHSLWSWL